jgi:hypothetical protein
VVIKARLLSLKKGRAIGRAMGLRALV